MILQSLTLRQFRSHRHLKLDVTPGVNLFIGLNGAGKTNLVEAVSVLTTGLSPRGADLESMVSWGESGFSVSGLFRYDIKELDPLALEIRYERGRSRVIKENESSSIRLKDLIGRVPIVSFVPEDLSLVKGEPEIRRRAMNMVLMQVDHSYSEDLRRYNENLKSRNAALKQIQNGELEREGLLPWNQALVERGLRICWKRDQFIREFSKRAMEIYEDVSQSREKIQIRYKPSHEY